jgi:hypothetical protein
VDEPHDLARVPDRVRREPRRDHGVDRPAGRLGQVEAAPAERAPHEIEALALDQRHRDQVRLDAALLQLFRQAAHVPLRPPVGKGRLGREDEDPARSQGAAGTRAIKA